ncbi:MAG: 3-hydroxyacyl-CoA dehydrogenase NAD-binding domain-containing protein [Gammaproteobacteria bacterium]|nr:3-hydroxyacyl-CoA dehydrogenase NAD-binding domain-containing protein [Gammaproteobacteria bacterium]
MTATDTQAYLHWHLETDGDGIAWLCIDKHDGSANVLSGAVLQELASIMEPWVRTPPAGIVLHSGKSNGFVMGADINEFTKIATADEAYGLIRLGQQVMDRLESLACPSVAVINGFALGGGLELAMACRYRIALENDKPVLGLPEVQLGIHPGFGGTVRAVRIAGVRAAMALMLAGQPITVGKGLRQGLVDRVVPAGGWRPAALDMLRSGRPAHRAPLFDRVLNLAPLRPLVARQLRAQVARKARRDHYPSPYAMIDLWVQHGASPKTGYEAEARSMAGLMVGSTARNLVRVFFLQNRLKSLGGKSGSKVARVHVIGAGVMGGDIAAWCALRGLEVTLQDREMKYIEPALARASKLFEKKARGTDAVDKARARLRADIAGDGVADADLVIEAIFENREAKQELYRSVEPRMKAGAILATNTSSIRLEELRTVLEAPQRFIGLHFFNPVAQLPLVEVIRCTDTETAALDTGFGFVKAIGKLPLPCSSSPGFVVNRILGPYMAEAMHLANEGVPLAGIDAAAEDFGMPMGPVELVDSVGLDIALNVSRVLGAAAGREAPGGLEDMVEQGRLGRKSGSGFYRWENGKAVKPEPGPAEKARIPADIVDRLMLPMVNEAVACLHEKVVEDADLLDAGVIFGTGFAPFRGGPVNYARERGSREVIAALERLADVHGERFRPHPGWSELG